MKSSMDKVFDYSAAWLMKWLRLLLITRGTKEFWDAMSDDLQEQREKLKKRGFSPEDENDCMGKIHDYSASLADFFDKWIGI